MMINVGVACPPFSKKRTKTDIVRLASIRDNEGAEGDRLCEEASPLPSVFQNQDNDGIGREVGSVVDISTPALDSPID